MAQTIQMWHDVNFVEGGVTDVREDKQAPNHGDLMQTLTVGY